MTAVAELHYLSAVDALRLFHARELSPVELVRAVLDRAAAVEPELNAFAESFPEEALAQARRAEGRYAAGDARPLEGLPVAVKEETPIAGQRNTLGSLALRDAVAAETAVVARRVLEAGAIVHARSTTPEFSCAPFTWSRLWGVTRNPWNTAYSPGGSSGGAGAALAAGSTTLATGSDIGGSIRIPAASCGVVGFKPPYGRVPEGAIFNLDHYCHEGPLARTVRDCALLENVLAGPDPSDIASLRPKLEIPERLEPIRGLRIALSHDLGCYPVADDVRAGTAAAAERLRDAGATVEEVSLPWTRAELLRAARIHFGMIFGPSMRELHAAHSEELTTYTRRFVAESEEIPKEAFVEGLELEGRIYAPLGELLERFDALVCPTLAIPAFPAEYDTDEPIEVDGRRFDHFLDVLTTVPFNILSRCPVLSVPSGRSREGVPTAISIVGRTYDDVTVFRVGAAHEERFPWLDAPERRPG